VDDQDAEDVAQSAIEVLLRRAADIEQGAAHEFLRSTVWRAASSLRRSRKEVLTEASPVADAPDPEQTLASAEVSAAVRDAVARMPESRRIVIDVLGAERTVADVAREEGIPESTARSRLEAGTEQLEADLRRQRAREKRKSGSTSWCPVWLAALDPRDAWRRARQTVQAAIRPAAALLAASTLGGAPHDIPTLGPTAIDMPARVLAVDTVRPVTALPAAERGAGMAAPEHRRARHDAGARFRAERFGR
jgi:RNA polymerase sigma factor (sigma-70 family)